MDSEDIWVVIIVFGLPVVVLIIWAFYTFLIKKDDIIEEETDTLKSK